MTATDKYIQRQTKERNKDGDTHRDRGQWKGGGGGGGWKRDVGDRRGENRKRARG